MSPSKNYALILNGDKRPDHLGNVERAIATLQREGAYSVAVVSPEQPKAKVDQYEPNQQSGLKKIIEGLQKKMDPDDRLVVYVTGHGNETPQGEACFELKDGCLSAKDLSQWVKPLPYGERIVFMDSCLSGAGLSWFVNPQTTVITQGAPGEVVSCQTFSPYFWSDQVPDQNKDGFISMAERYQYALEQGKTTSLAQFFATKPRSFREGAIQGSFSGQKGLITVHNQADFEKALDNLKPAQMALVLFGADWCVPCKAYLPTFRSFQNKYNGQFKLIYFEGVKESEKETFEKYKIDTTPKLVWFDHRKNATLVPDELDPIKSLAPAVVLDESERRKIYIERLNHPDPEMRMAALLQLAITPDEAEKIYELLWPMTLDKNQKIREKAIYYLTGLGMLKSKIRADIEKRFGQKKDKYWHSAAFILALLTKEDPGQAKKLIKELLPALKGQDSSAWNTVVVALTHLDAHFTPDEVRVFIDNLRQNLKSTDSLRRFRAASALCRVAKDFPGIFEALKESLNSREPGQVVGALKDIRKYFPKKSKEVASEILTLFKHPDVEVRTQAILFIEKCRLKTPEIVAALREKINDPEPIINIGATMALGELVWAREFDRIGQLKKFAQSKNPKLAFMAKRQLERLEAIRQARMGISKLATMLPPMDDILEEFGPRQSLEAGLGLGFYSSGESAGLFLTPQFSYQIEDWEMRGEFLGPILTKKDKPYSWGFTLGANYHFSKALFVSELTGHLTLPSIGYRSVVDSDEEMLSLLPAGGGLRYFINHYLDLELQVKSRIDFPLEGGDVKLGVEAPLNLKFNIDRWQSRKSD